MSYLAADHAVASMEIGPRALADVLGPHLKAPVGLYIYVTVKVTADVLDLTDKSSWATEDEIRLWLKSPNKALRLERPVDLIARGELGKLKEVLTDAFMAAHGG